ncbi:acetyltransferase [Tenacibaculum sp. MEBiC06402]|uniref:PglD-related sugar-binding protein n=1 Tax=unclassified Tenacibaculum TaxID=2635139 RepID=UPI003B9AA4E8
MKKIAIIGSGGLGREVHGIIQAINRKNPAWDFIGFYDDSLTDELINGYPVLGKIDDLNQIKEQLEVVIAIGNPKVKELIKNKITNPKIKFPNLIHPSVEIYSEENVVLGQGVVIAANSVLTVNIEISDFVYVNTAAVIAHDTKIGTFSMIMPTVSISAGGIIGKKVYIGNGAKIDYSINIEDNTKIKAGSILTQ